MTGPRLLVCAPMWVEARAVRRALPADHVLRSGYGARSRAAGARIPPATSAVAVAGLAGATRDDLLPGDVVVATEVIDATSAGDGSTIRLPTAPLLANALRRNGCRVHTGAVRTVDRVLSGREAGRAGADGVLAVDLESAPLARAAAGRPVAVARVVVDTPGRPLRRVDLAVRGVRALAGLSAVARGIEAWAGAGGEHEAVLVGGEPEDVPVGGDHEAMSVPARPLPARADAAGKPVAGVPDRVVDATAQALRDPARGTDLVLVVGPAGFADSRSPSGSTRLAGPGPSQGAPVYVIDDVHQLSPEWLAGARRIGIVTGTPARADLVAELLDVLRGLGPCRIRVSPAMTGTVPPNLPEEVRA
jgi:hypothetical protein